jgi:hypothetical protein
VAHKTVEAIFWPYGSGKKKAGSRFMHDVLHEAKKMLCKNDVA